MANLFKSKLDSLVKSMSSLIMGEDAKQKDEFTLQCEALDKQVEEFKSHEKELYADIGVVAIEKYGAEPFGELGQSFAQVQEQIKAAEAQKAELIRVHEEELRAAEEARKAEEERKAAEEAARLAEEARKAEEAARLAAEAEAAQAQPAARPAGAVCPICGHENAQGMKFCGECGARLVTPGKTVCPVCGYENAPGVKFCGECGTRLEAPVRIIDSEPAAPAAAAEPAAPAEEAPADAAVEEAPADVTTEAAAADKAAPDATETNGAQE